MANGDYDKGWFWKPVALVLLTALLTGSGAYMYTTSMFCTKAEAKDMVDNAPYPWNLDRKFVLQALVDIKADVREIKNDFRAYDRQIND